MNDQHDDHAERLQAAIAARLERVRGSLSDAEFAQLVAELARAADRFARLDTDPLTRIAMDTGLMPDGAVVELVPLRPVDPPGARGLDDS